MTALAFLGFLVALPVHAQVARLTVQDARGRPVTAVRVGDPLRVVVTVRPPAGAFPLFPEPPADPTVDSTALRFGEARVLALDRRPPHLEDEVRTDSAVYTAAVFSLDSARLGPVEVRLVAGTDTAVVRAAPVLLEVTAMTPDSAALHPPGPPRGFPRAWGPPFLITLGALLALAL
ncbi:MAG TPA: hypothetical protein VK610_05895, partial [Rhodothermales bacterium]|nr:hypothetical protein [Rhodothermales bacterium]